MPLQGYVGQTLVTTVKFTHKGPAFDPWICLFFARNRHQELGRWPSVAFRASWLGCLVNDDAAETEYQVRIQGYLGLSTDMMGKTFDVLRIVSREEVLKDASNLSSVRFDDDWDDNVVSVIQY